MKQEEVDLVYRRCRVDGCEKKPVRHRICGMHQSRWKRNGSYELTPKKICLKNNPGNVIETIKICKIHGDLEFHNIYFLPNSNHKFCKLCQHINRTKALNKIKNEEKHLNQRIYLTNLKCDRCIKIRPKDDFYNTNLKRKNLYCKYCCRAFTKESDLKIKFGLTLDDYNNLLKKHDNCCAICKEQENVKNPKSGQIIKLSVDHCHSTGKIRGLLCNRCNFGIGYLKDSIDLLRNAIEYLEK